MPLRAEPGLALIVPQHKTKAQVLAESLRALFCCGSDAMASSTPKASLQAEKPGLTESVGRIEQAESEALLRDHHSSVNIPRSNSSQANHLEGTCNPPIATQKSKSDFKTTVNNTGAFHDSNLSHINQGNYSTVNQGSISATTFNMVQHVNENGLSGLNLLKEFVAFDALHDSSAQDPKRRCHPGTRESVLKTVRNWIDNPNADQKIFWLHGPAGVGKSAIAQTISHSYERDKVAATFFFFRSDPNRSDGNRLVPTLAWQLAFSIPHAKDSATLALNEKPDLPRKSIEIQFEMLLVRPLQAIAQVPQVQTPAPVIIIDGVDECSDNDLQRRFLDTLGKAAVGSQLPLRFLISSRPEAHIKECFNRFQCPTLRIDLANVNDALGDIEKYLMTEFARIASEQGITPDTWPGQKVIDDLVNKSSGQFVYVATIIKFVGDEDENANSQLDIILGLEPSDSKSPFADLDALYMEILQRQRHQEFLKEFLAILIGRSTSEDFSGSDDPLLFNTDEKGLHRRLRGMHSLLKIELRSAIDVHHRSFIDFLLDPLRSGRYYTSEHSGRRRFLELIVAAIVRHAPKVVKDPISRSSHGSEHFAPQFSAICDFPRRIDIPLEDWQEVLRPLLSLREEMLKFTHSYSPWKRGFCDGCSIFYTIDDLLLHLSFFRGSSHAKSRSSNYRRSLWYSRSLRDMVTALVDHEHPDTEVKQRNCMTTKFSEGGQYLERDNASASDLAETMAVGVKWTGGTTFDKERDNHSYWAKEPCSDGLDSCLAYLLAVLRSGEPDLRLMAEPVQRLLNCDYAETVSKLRSLSDTQNLLDLIFYMIHNRTLLPQCGADAMHRASELALEIYARVPLIPQSLFMIGLDIQIHDEDPNGLYHGTLASGKHKIKAMFWNLKDGIFPMCKMAFVWGTLSHENVMPLLGVCEAMATRFFLVTPYMEYDTLRQWHDKVNPSGLEIRDRMLEVARAVQYIHSLGFVLWWLMGSEIFIDSNFHVKIPGYCISPQYLRETPSDYISLRISPKSRTREYNIFRFGCLYYEIYFGVDIYESGEGKEDRTEVVKRLAEPKIHDDVWNLIQRCCAEDPKSRPAMDDIVKEMESWSCF